MRGLLASLTLSLALPIFAQNQPNFAPANFDPSDVYFQGYLASRSGEQLEATGNFIGASEKYRKALELFSTVQKYYPTWKPEMVGRRAEKTQIAVSAAQDKAKKQLDEKRNAVAELEGGVRVGAQAIDPTQPALNSEPAPSILKVDPVSTRRLKEAQQEVERLRQQLADQMVENNRLENLSEANSNRHGAAPQQSRKLIEDRLKAAEANVSKLQSRLAKVPVESQMLGLDHKIQQLEQERQAMALALQQSQSGYTHSMERIASLEADLLKARQEAADLNRNLEDQRSTANSVVAGQRKQLEILQLQLKEKSNELATANQEIGSLKRELSESRDAFGQLRQERDALLVERDQMAALLKLNEGGRIQEMIEQNMALAKNLRESNEKVDRLCRESNGDKDQLTESLRDLAIAKSQINRLHQEKKEQQKRLAELESRLKQEEDALASGKASEDPTEVLILRDIIKRQLGVQSRRIQARNLLVDATKKLSIQDPQLAEAIALFDSQEIVLSPEEQKLVADREVDGEFISPYARSRAAVNQSTNALDQEITTYERAAQKSFLAGRLMPARELYELILEQHPGHVATLCKMGVVQLKLKDPEAASDAFRRAVELDNRHPYALRMLAYTLMKAGNLEEAEQVARESVKIAPNDDKAHMLLATLCFELGQQKDAEAHFKGAINVNPLPSEPYYNLALIYSSSGRIEKAKQFYQQALERGALPDPKLEETLSMQ